MNIIQKALSDVRFAIPPEVLQFAFADTTLMRQGVPLSLDHLIREKVIDARVIPDCNLRGGKQLEIPLDGLRPQMYHNGMMVYHIPKERTDGCTITSVLSLTFGSHPAYNALSGRGYFNHHSDLMSTGSALLTSSEQPPNLSTAAVQLIGENSVLIKGPRPLPGNAYLRCNIEHDGGLSNIAPASWPVFSRLVELAVKAYIYINKRVILDQGYLHGGMNLGAIQDFVEQYADANELYQELMQERWGKVTHANDEERMGRTLAFQIGITR